MKFQRLNYLGLLVICNLISILKCEVRFLYEMFRHGARSPWEGLDSNYIDVYGEQWAGQGELTAVGMRQHYLLGVRNRMKYGDFISKVYNPKEIYVVSTDYNRTILSAMSQLQGWFSQGEGPILSEEQNKVAIPPVSFDFDGAKEKLGNSSLPNRMQVIPVHLFDMEAKRTQLFDQRVCPSTAPYLKENRERQVVKDSLQNFNNTWGEKLMKALNVTDPNHFVNFDHVYSVCDSFTTGYTEGHEYKVLKNAGIDIEAFNKTVVDFLFLDLVESEFGDPDMYIAKMSMSPIMQEVIQWMDTRINDDIRGIGFVGYAAPKLVMYSAHDVTLTALQIYFKAVLNTTDLYYTPYASSFFMELHRRDNVDDSNLTHDDYYVHVQYNDIQLLNVTYSDFKSNVVSKSINATEISKFCGFNTSAASVDGFFVATIILSLACVGLIVYVVFTCMKKKPETAVGYDSVV